MKTFKHKNGSIAEVHGELARACGYEFPTWMLGSDWQEVTKDYEIINWSRGGHSYASSTISPGREWFITSVKRLSDGLVVSIDDDVHNTNYPETTGKVYEIKEQDGEIYVYYTPNKGCDLLKDIQKSRKPDKDYEILRYKGVAPIEITSVMRLPDGEVFSVGGNAEHKAGLLDGRIEKITEEDGEVRIHFHSGSIRLEDADKISRQPILTSENGVELFEGDEYWWMYDNGSVIHKGIIRDRLYSENKIFSTREAAEEYRVDNYRGLCLNDLDICMDISEDEYNELKELVKSRLK